MKFRLTEDMRKKIWLYVIVIAIGISIYFAFDKIDFIIRSLRRVCSLTTPFILGFAIAFLLNKPMELIEVKLLGRLRMKPSIPRHEAAAQTKHCRRTGGSAWNHHCMCLSGTAAAAAV